MNDVVSVHKISRHTPLADTNQTPEVSRMVGFSSSWVYFLLEKSYVQKYINNLTGSDLTRLAGMSFFPSKCVMAWLDKTIFYTAYCTEWMKIKLIYLNCIYKNHEQPL